MYYFTLQDASDCEVEMIYRGNEKKRSKTYGKDQNKEANYFSLV